MDNNLQVATAHCKRTLRRRAAAEHALPIDDCIWIWATEYRLGVLEMEWMHSECIRYSAKLERRRNDGPELQKV